SSCAASSAPRNSFKQGRPFPWRRSPRTWASRTRATSPSTSSVSSAFRRGSSGRPQESSWTGLDGEFTVWAGGRKAVLRPGDDLLIPAGTAHVVAATGDVPGRALVVASPSGFARLVTKAGTPDEGRGVPTSAAPDMDLFLPVC